MEFRYLLDTNILSYAIKNPKGLVSQRLQSLPGEQACTSIVVACELRYGVALRASTALASKVEELLANIAVLPLDEGSDRHYGDIRATLEKSGKSIDHNDLLIAAHARSLGLTLVTNNLREFERVPDLLVTNWLDPA
ncbi:MAG: type II toxin-antitoxin system VapC family toxin [Methylococcaceae bacterium]|nr:type II toxin-antitoxin system VapC family toxin [Methylococcaceae bacterium]